MLSNLQPQSPDKILALMAEFRADPRAEKIDLGVGVYKDETGLTPVMRAVRKAEERILREETTKTYTALPGEPAYREAMARLILGDDLPVDRLATVASVGGTGALRVGIDLARMANPALRVWVSDPTWPNHVSILNYLGVETLTYRYFDAETRGVNFDGMIEDLRGAKPGDLVLLHGCCHNPTGANLNIAQWDEVAALLAETGATPLIDLAYQGFGDGLDADAAGTRLIASRLPEVLIAASCSKNFGIYRERTGILLAICPDSATRDLAQGAMAHLNRQTFSFPPDHGARIVTTILTDPELRRDWETELEEVRTGMLDLREQLVRELRERSGSDRFGFLAAHRGMFSRLGATPEQVETLKRDYGIYLVGDSRLNIAGLNKNTVPVLAQAIIDVGI
ncbi:aromatic amino acid transaminase [Paracoccus pacificus]|uniref:Aromatic amino acid transaminase n=1 Tax=Paracoccus pacificus TaxID=1463598 RepID=A0ABW4R585_9RHOB